MSTNKRAKHNDNPTFSDSPTHNAINWAAIRDADTEKGLMDRLKKTQNYS